jgi:hypothetical protein
VTQFSFAERVEAIVVVFVAPGIGAVAAGWLASVLIGDGPLALGAAMLGFWGTLVPLYNWRRRRRMKENRP